jgi:hypothetical protein
MNKSFIILFLFFSGLCAAQRHNSIYLLASPNDLGLGARYDYSFKTTGIYASFEQGHYNIPFGGEIKKHDKISIGVTQFDKKGFDREDYIFLSGGACYHVYRGVTNIKDKNILDPWSLEIGSGIAVRRLTFAVSVDVIKFDVGLCFGVKFNYK